MSEYRITVEPPSGGPSAVARYLNRSVLKLVIAEWHRHEFGSLDDALTREHFSRFPRLSIDALGHGDGVFLQLSGAFDAYACAVAHRHGLDEPDLASFRARLADACEQPLAERIQAVAAAPEQGELTAYRNLAAHRGVVGERISMGEREDDSGRRIRLVLPERLPAGVPDKPRSPVRPVLERYAVWARPALRGLHNVAIAEWNLGDDSNLIAEYWNLRPTSRDDETGRA
jgi:hypothetical protein